MLVLGAVGRLEVLIALGLVLLGLGLDLVLIRALGLGDGRKLVGVWSALARAHRVDVLLQALGLVEIPLVGGLVLGQHRLVLLAHGPAAGHFLQAADQGRQRR